MKTVPPIIISLLCIALLFSAGCTGGQAPQPGKTITPIVTATPVVTTSPPTPVPATTLVTPSVTTTTQEPDPYPKEITYLPPATAVDIGIDKDRVYNTITVTFVGGPGQALVSNILVRVTTSEGLVQQKNFPTNAAGIGTGASVDLKGTKGSDRVEVFVTQGGVMYKLRDENVTHFYY